jgi:hypothetical protein
VSTIAIFAFALASFDTTTADYNYRCTMQGFFVYVIAWSNHVYAVVLPTLRAIKSRDKRRAAHRAGCKSYGLVDISAMRLSCSTTSSDPVTAGVTAPESNHVPLQYTRACFEYVLQSEVLFEELRQFSARALSAQNILFHEQYRRLKAVWNARQQDFCQGRLLNDSPSDDVVELNPSSIVVDALFHFYRNFFGSGASLEVRLPTHCVKEVHQKMKEPISDIKFLESAHQHVLDNVTFPSFPLRTGAGSPLGSSWPQKDL